MCIRDRRCDTNSLHLDSAYFASLRPIELMDDEKKLYEDYAFRKDTTALKPPSKRRVFWGEIGDFLLSDLNVDLSRIGSVKCSPIINPLLLSYSGSNGFSWRQDFKYNRLFSGRCVYETDIKRSQQGSILVPTLN